MAKPIIPPELRAAALLELRRRERERQVHVPDKFGEWIEVARPEMRWDARHFRAMQETLDRVTAGELRFVIFLVPIRHGKTEHNTYGYTTYNFVRNPRFRGLLASYNAPIAQKFSREIRKLVRAQGIQLGDRDSAGEWETAAGGYLRALGARAGAASLNADGIIIDDPIGSRADAESLATRNQVYDWIANDILARMQPSTWAILTMSRWHPDDPVGRLLKQMPGVWHVVDLPVFAEEGDPLGRKIGEVLWPEERPEEWVNAARTILGSHGFQSQMMLRPRPRAGGMFQWEWWKVLDVVPICTHYVRYWDLAGTEPVEGKNDPDYSVGTLVGRMQDGRTCVIHQAAFQHSVQARDAEIERVAMMDRRMYGHSVTHWIEREAGIGGQERTNAIMRKLHAIGLTVYTEPATGSKSLRAEPLQSAAEAGNVCFAPDDETAPWHDAFRLEACDFPQVVHDDRVDSAAGAYNKIAVPDAEIGFISLRM